MKISGYRILITLLIISPYYFLNTNLSKIESNIQNHIGKIIIMNFLTTLILLLIIILFSICSDKFNNNVVNLLNSISSILKYIFKYPMKLLKHLDKLLTKEYKL